MVVVSCQCAWGMICAWACCSIMSVCRGHDMVVVSCQCVGGMI